MMRLQESKVKPLPMPGVLAPSPGLGVCDGAARAAVEGYIAGIFQISYGAQVNEFMPLLVGLRESLDFSAALGLRGGSDGPLFCEQYLTDPVETYVPALFGETAERGRIFEMGHLVASNHGHAALLYTLVGAALYEAGIDYLLFTANRAVRISLQRNGFAGKQIAVADRRRLGAAGDDWGSYYESGPRVMLGDVRAAMRRRTAVPAIRQLLRQYQTGIDGLVAAIEELQL